jgi:elongation factor Tu
VVIAPGSVQPHAKARAELFLLTQKEGGRHTPVTRGYKPQFFFGTTDVTGTISDLGSNDLLAPGDHAEIGLELLKPVGMEAGMRFAVREGSKTVGAGVVLSVE